MTTVVFVNGPVNTGKTTVGKHLAARLAGARFLDGDDHGSAAEGLIDRIRAAQDFIAAALEEVDAPYLVVAYPLRHEDYGMFTDICRRRGLPFLVVTLAPPLDVALSNRGRRHLTDAERRRVADMYAEGYAQRLFSDITLNNADITAEEASDMIAQYLLARRRA